MDIQLIQSGLIVFLVGLIGAIMKFSVSKINEWSKEIKSEMETLGRNLTDIAFEIKEIRKDFDRVNIRFETYDAELRLLRQRVHHAENTIASVLGLLDLLKYQGCKDGHACPLGEVLAKFDPLKKHKQQQNGD